MGQANHTDFHYEICVEEHIDNGWFDLPDNIEIRHTFNAEGLLAVSFLNGSFHDQSALYGFLDTLRDLNLKLIYIRRIEAT
jgi:hypothetical protein